VSLPNNQQMRQGSNEIYLSILDLPQHVSTRHCHHQEFVVTSEATQAIYKIQVLGAIIIYTHIYIYIYIYIYICLEAKY
jgi:hypothetical protein